jgi:DNA-binding HxlR family transcriptional regulator
MTAPLWGAVASVDFGAADVTILGIVVTKQKVGIRTTLAAARTVDPCPIEPVVDLVFGRWTSHVLWTLAHKGRMRFNELHAQIPAVTPKVLTERLRQLERDGFVERTYHREIPPRVEYEMTPLADTLTPLFRKLAKWSDQHLDEVEQARARYDGERNGS